MAVETDLSRERNTSVSDFRYQYVAGLRYGVGATPYYTVSWNDRQKQGVLLLYPVKTPYTRKRNTYAYPFARSGVCVTAWMGNGVHVP